MSKLQINVGAKLGLFYKGMKKETNIKKLYILKILNIKVSNKLYYVKL